MLIEEKKKMVKVTSRQINEVANEVRSFLPTLARSYGKFACDVAVNCKGVIEIEADGPLAKEIKRLS